MAAFIFGGDTSETPESIKRKREIVRALMAAQGAPRNVGEGLNALGDGIVANVLDRRADKAEAAGRDSANSAFAPLASMIGGGSPGAEAEMSASDPAPVDISGDRKTFVESLLPAAMEESKRTGVDPRIIVAQAAQETGWGKSAPGNNFFGIKSHGQGGGQTLATNEVIDGKTVRINDSFRQFASPQDSVKGYGDFILQNPRYKGLREAKGLDAQLQALGASGYATDPNYANSVGSIARGIQLPQEVASVDPSIGMPAAAGQMSATSPQPVPMPQPAAPTPAPRQQVAQALSAPPQPQQVDTRAVINALSNPFLSPGQRAVGEALLQQETQRRQALLEQQLKQSDPKYRLDLEKGQIELDQLRNPRIAPADQARIELERSKLDFERNKPKDPTKVSQGEILVDPVTGKEIYKAAPKPEAKPSAVQEYEYAKEQGFPGTFQDWEASKKGGMSLQVDPATGAVTFQQGGNIKPMTEGQSKDAVFSTRAAGALPLIDKFGDSLTGTEGMVGGTVGQLPVVGNFAKTEGFQQAEQAGKEFLQAILRKDTGAAITKEETAEYGSVYLPRPGDSPQLLQQKKASRTRALEAIKAGMPPQAILAQEKALANTDKATEDDKPPAGIDPADWKFMTPAERKLFK